MPDQAHVAREAEAVMRKRRGAGMVNVEVTDQAGTLSTAQHRERRIKQELELLERESIAPPWPEPGRQALRAGAGRAA